MTLVSQRPIVIYHLRREGVRGVLLCHNKFYLTPFGLCAHWHIPLLSWQSIFHCSPLNSVSNDQSPSVPPKNPTLIPQKSSSHPFPPPPSLWIKYDWSLIAISVCEYFYSLFSITTMLRYKNDKVVIFCSTSDLPHSTRGDQPFEIQDNSVLLRIYKYLKKKMMAVLQKPLFNVALSAQHSKTINPYWRYNFSYKSFQTVYCLSKGIGTPSRRRNHLVPRSCKLKEDFNERQDVHYLYICFKGSCGQLFILISSGLTFMPDRWIERGSFTRNQFSLSEFVRDLCTT